MPKVTLTKAARYPLGSSIVHRSGTVLDVDEADMNSLRELGVIALLGETKPEPVKEKAPSPEQDETPAQEQLSSGYPQLPKKTAPVAEWKEYARKNDIKLAGLSKRNEIIGFVTKMVTS